MYYCTRECTAPKVESCEYIEWSEVLLLILLIINISQEAISQHYRGLRGCAGNLSKPQNVKFLLTRSPNKADTILYFTGIILKNFKNSILDFNSAYSQRERLHSSTEFSDK